MIDASHNVKDPLEDIMQSINAIETAYAKALIVDQKALEQAQLKNDVVLCQNILQDAFNTNVSSILARARLLNNAALNPIDAFRKLGIRKQLIKERGLNTTATGL